jgi:hypothetical protein
MSWLTRSFDEYTLIWLVISSTLGGAIGAAITFLFQDLLGPWLTYRRESDRILRKYTTPLLRSATRLENRINIVVRNADQPWYANDEYFRLSTLYIFGDYLGWVRNIEREYGFVPIESARRGQLFNERFNGFFAAMTSFSYFRWAEDTQAVADSALPRLMCSAIGEAMTSEDDRTKVMGFTEFATTYSNDEQFRRWFADLDAHLRRSQPSDAFWWDRLIVAQANLRALCAFLDKKGHMVRKAHMANLELLNHIDVLNMLIKSFPDLAPPQQVTINTKLREAV